MRMKVNNSYVIFISVYVLIMVYLDQVKEEFYEQLDYVIQFVLYFDKLFLFGDFNVCVGLDYIIWDKVFGYYGIGKENLNGIFLLILCVEKQLVIINMFFMQKDSFKMIWRYLCFGYWY